MSIFEEYGTFKLNNDVGAAAWFYCYYRKKIVFRKNRSQTVSRKPMMMMIRCILYLSLRETRKGCDNEKLSGTEVPRKPKASCIQEPHHNAHYKEYKAVKL